MPGLCTSCSWTVCDQWILRWDTFIVLTSKLRLQTIALAHKGHLHVAIVGTKENLRSKVRWPCMDKAAEKFCKSCYECQLLAHPYPRIEWKQGSSHLFRSCNWSCNSAWHTSNTKLWKTSEIEEASERFRYKNFVLQWWTDHLNFKNSLKLKNKVIDNFVTLWLSFVKDIHGEIYWQSRKLQE